MMLVLTTAFAADWTVLQAEQVRIACRSLAKGEECEASAHLEVPIETVQKAVIDLEAYPQRYASIDTVQRHDNGDVTMAFALPFPLSDWTARASVEQFDEGQTQVIALAASPTTSGTALFETWQYRLTPTATGTQVTLLWESNLGWPHPVRSRIHKAQGHNFLWGLALSLNATPVVGSGLSSR